MLPKEQAQTLGEAAREKSQSLVTQKPRPFGQGFACLSVVKGQTKTTPRQPSELTSKLPETVTLAFTLHHVISHSRETDWPPVGDPLSSDAGR